MWQRSVLGVVAIPQGGYAFYALLYAVLFYSLRFLALGQTYSLSKFGRATGYVRWL